MSERKQEAKKPEMCVYALTTHAPSQNRIIGLFATREEAQAIIDRAPKKHYIWLGIERMVLGRESAYWRWAAQFEAAGEAERDAERFHAEELAEIERRAKAVLKFKRKGKKR